MLVGLLGDIHTEIGVVNYWVRRMKDLGFELDAMLQVGDFGFYHEGAWQKYHYGKQTFDIPTIVIPGNHESRKWHAMAQARSDEGAIKNFKLLGQGEIYEFIKNDETLRILAVGSAECVDNPPEEYRMPYDPEDYLRALDDWEVSGKPHIDILMTHDCPKSVQLPGNPHIARLFNLPPSKTPGEANLSILWQAVRPDLQVNGHHHKWWEAEVDGLRHLSLPEGQRGMAIYDTISKEYHKF